MVCFRKSSILIFLTLVFPVFAAGNSAAGDALSPALMMNIIMWACLIVLLTIGGKFAWGPILKQINEREKKISKGLEDAKKSTEKLAEIEEEKKNILYKAQDEAKTIVVEAKSIAEKLANEISTQAKNEANSYKEKALLEIEAHKKSSLQELQKESAHLAIAIAGKILDKNLDNDSNQALVNKLIKDI